MTFEEWNARAREQVQRLRTDQAAPRRIVGAAVARGAPFPRAYRRPNWALPATRPLLKVTIMFEPSWFFHATRSAVVPATPTWDTCSPPTPMMALTCS